MIDKYGRNIDYIRISLTDRCNLRCVYCMPEEGVQSLQHSDILTFDEITRICTVMAAQGLKKIKLTGGEPLVRRNCVGLIALLKQIPGIEQVTLTTNGILLKEQLASLIEAGLDAVNISLDTLDPVRFCELTRRDELQKVLDGIEKAVRYPQLTTKLNCVPMLKNQQDIFDVAEMARKYPLHVRYIEMMPVGQGKDYSSWDEATILAMLEERYGKSSSYEKVLGNGPGHYYTFAGFQGKIGFISAISHKFCEQCNRIRLTADGFLKACLQYQIGEDLKSVIRNGCTDEELLQVINQVLERKPIGHHFLEQEMNNDEARIMAQIGG